MIHHNYGTGIEVISIDAFAFAECGVSTMYGFLEYLPLLLWIMIQASLSDLA